MFPARTAGRYLAIGFGAGGRGRCSSWTRVSGGAGMAAAPGWGRGGPAVLFCPGRRGVTALAGRPPAALVRALRKAVHPLHVGRVVVSTGRAHAAALLTVIGVYGLGWHVVSNRRDVMALPPGVTKATGL